MTYKYDFLVIGSGIGGMSYALKVADKGTVALICKTELEEANTYYAQGGIASVTNTVVDNFKKHIEDTLIAGDGHCKRSAVEKVVLNAPKEIEELLRWGVDFDKDEKGDFDLHREGRSFGAPDSASQRQHWRRDSGKPHQESQVTSEHQRPGPSLCDRDHHAAPPGRMGDASDAEH